MNNQSAIYETERTFLRSCLESAPSAAFARPFNVYGANSKPARPCLHVLKQRLLRQALEQAGDAELQKQICGAANVAAGLAWETSSPLLLFPCLFAEMTAAICERVRQNEFTGNLVDLHSSPAPNHHEDDDLDPAAAWAHPNSADEDRSAALNVLAA